MSNRVFYIVLVFVLVIMGGIYIASPKSKQQKVVLAGVATHQNQGNNHIGEGTKHAAYNSDLPSSGPHYEGATAPAQWGIYTQELPPEVFLHNEEHGGVIIAYQPTLPPAEIRTLQKLFASPSSDKSFTPGKFILMPRTANKQPIELAAWRRTYSLQRFNQTNIEQFYLQNVSNKLAPESFAGPTNKPINEAVQ